MEKDGFRLYLVPEYRSMLREFGADAPQAVLDMASGRRPAAAQTATREAGTYQAVNALRLFDALEAVSLDAARVLGLGVEIGSIEPGKRADFTILDADPLETDGKDWPSIKVWGVVLDGKPRPATRP